MPGMSLSLPLSLCTAVAPGGSSQEQQREREVPPPAQLLTALTEPGEGEQSLHPHNKVQEQGQ